MQPVRVAVARHVEPVPRHLLAVPRRSEKMIHHFPIRIGRLVGEERIRLLHRRRQPSDRKGYAADQSLTIRFRGKCETFALETIGDEGINWILKFEV